MRRLFVALGMTLVLATVVTPADATSSYQVPISIDATGLTDVTSQLNHFMAEVPDGSVIAFQPNAHYRVEGTLNLIDRSHLTIAGNGASTFATTTGGPTRAGWEIDRGTDITIDNLTVNGANPQSDWTKGYNHAVEWQAGVRIRGVAAVTLAHVTVNNVYGDFVYVGRDLNSGQWPRDVTVRDSHFDRAGRQGVAITSGENITITRNAFSGVALFVFDVEPNDGLDGARQVQITDNRIGPSHAFFSAGGRPAPIQGITVARNNLSGVAFGVAVQRIDNPRASSISIADNTSDTPLSTGAALVTLERVDGASIRGNRAPMDSRRRQPAIASVRSCDVQLASNAFPGVTELLRTDSWQCAPQPTVAEKRSASSTSGGTDSPEAHQETLAAPKPAGIPDSSRVTSAPVRPTTRSKSGIVAAPLSPSAPADSQSGSSHQRGLDTDLLVVATGLIALVGGGAIAAGVRRSSRISIEAGPRGRTRLPAWSTLGDLWDETQIPT